MAPVPSPPDRRNVFDFHQPPGSSSLSSSFADASRISGSVDSNGMTQMAPPEEAVDGALEENDSHALHLARNGSIASSAAKAQIQEEGQMHRFGQKFRRELMRPTGTLDYEHGTTAEDKPEPAHVAKLRNRLEQYSGETYRKEIEEKGVDRVIKELGFNMEELRMMEKDDPEAFENFQEAQLAAQINMRQDKSTATAPTAENASIYAAT